ncbi:hypothetical protein ACWGBH_27665 [Streptomyces massasporeus]
MLASASAAVPAAGTLLGAPEAEGRRAGAGASGRRTVALRDGWRFAPVNPGGITDPTGAHADARHSLPAAIEVAVWDGRAWRRARDTEIGRAAASDAPIAITFKALRGSRIRLTLASRHPGEARGALRISRLDTP